MQKHHLIFFALVGILTVFLLKNRSIMTQRPNAPAYKDMTLQLWDYQCIDTMKTSRDKARGWAKDTALEGRIEKEMNAISQMGANCVAIDTPYDSEFSNYLSLWIKKAREKNLRIWFRGNFAQWEHWFDYQGELTEADLFSKATAFIQSNTQYFENGDIFTIAPEAENGGPFDQVEVNEHERFRKFLIREYQICTEAFSRLNKNVICNWSSMNGGFARRMLDAKTLTEMGNRVTLDHYINSPQQMGEYVNYFKTSYNADVVIGEFGAPIPEINGKMTDTEQASFTGELLQQLYKHRLSVSGLCYWTLYDGSTALLNQDYSPRPVVSVLSNYYKPGKVKGVITDKLATPLAGIKITTPNGVETVTDANGQYELMLPAGENKLIIEGKDYGNYEENIHIEHYTVYEFNKYLSPVNPGLLYKLRLKLLQIS